MIGKFKVLSSSRQRLQAFKVRIEVSLLFIKLFR